MGRYNLSLGSSSSGKKMDSDDKKSPNEDSGFFSFLKSEIEGDSPISPKLGNILSRFHRDPIFKNNDGDLSAGLGIRRQS